MFDLEFFKKNSLQNSFVSDADYILTVFSPLTYRRGTIVSRPVRPFVRIFLQGHPLKLSEILHEVVTSDRFTKWAKIASKWAKIAKNDTFWTITLDRSIHFSKIWSKCGGICSCYYTSNIYPEKNLLCVPRGLLGLKMPQNGHFGQKWHFLAHNFWLICSALLQFW